MGGGETRRQGSGASEVHPLPLGEGRGEGPITHHSSLITPHSPPLTHHSSPIPPHPLRQAIATPPLAVGFLTALPVPLPASSAVAPMGWAVACFPLVGAALGAGLALLDRLLGLWLPPAVAAALLLAALLAVTGALHLDGLMDSFDGLFGGRDPAGRLAIMRDSRVGSFGIAAAGSLLLVEYGALTSLAAEERAVALVLALSVSRWAMAATLWAFPAAASSGLAAGLKPLVRWRHLAMATAMVGGIAFASSGVGGLAVWAAGGLLVLLGGRLAVARMGGVNGDICGSLGQLVEAMALVLSVAA